MNPKTIVIWLLAFVTFVGGAMAQYFYQRHAHAPGLIDLALVAISLFLMFYWYRLDTDQRSYRRTYLLNVGIVGCGLIAFPYYFFRSRGVRSGFVASSLFLLAIIGSFAVSWAGRYLVYFMARG